MTRLIYTLFLWKFRALLWKLTETNIARVAACISPKVTDGAYDRERRNKHFYLHRRNTRTTSNIYLEARIPGSCASLWGWDSSMYSAKWHPLVCNAVSKFTSSEKIIIISGAVATPIHGCLVFSTRIPCFQLFMTTLPIQTAVCQSFLRLRQMKSCGKCKYY